ncbi:MAG: hypothetical protein ACXW32_08590, partial [Limisphaerales bacterium]
MIRRTMWVVLLVACVALCGIPSRAQSTTNAPVSFKGIQTFLQSARTNENLRAQVRGTVTYSFPNGSFYIQDETTGLFVSSLTNSLIEVGDPVEVLGTSVHAGFSPILMQEAIRSLGARKMAAPKSTGAKEIMAGQHDMTLVTLRASLLELTRASNGTIVLRLLEGSIPFSAELRAAEIPNEWGALLTQSYIRLTGVCTIGGDSGLVRNFRILLRTPDDVEILRAPPWWTFARTMRVVIILGVLILGGLVWVAALNHQVRQQTRELRKRFEREAELEDQYQDLFENAQELILTLDATGKFLNMNK